jgi:hypothetical protein
MGLGLGYSNKYYPGKNNGPQCFPMKSRDKMNSCLKLLSAEQEIILFGSSLKKS